MVTSESSPSQAESVLRLQQEILRGLVQRVPLRAIIDELTELVGEMVPGSLGSVMLADPETGRLSIQDTSCLPPEAVAGFQDVTPGVGRGSCAAAFHAKQPVIVEDTSTDPRWAEIRDAAAKLGIRSCWSLPVFSGHGEVAGTFAISRPVTGAPTEQEYELLSTAANLTGVALELDRADREMRRQTSLLENIIEGSEDPIFLKDTSGRYMLVNSAEAKGMPLVREEFIGRTDFDLYPEEIAAESRRTDREVIETGKGLLYEQSFDVDGKRIYLIRKSPLLGSDGSVHGVIGVARDITALKRSEEAVRRTQKLESLGVLAGGLAHDFNNLLTGILGNVDVALLRSARGEPVDHELREIQRASQRAAELTNQMLAYSGRSDFVKRVLDPAALVEDVTQLLSSSLCKKTRFEFAFGDDLPNIEADPTQMRQVVMNILTNASEAHGGESGLVEVRLERVRFEDLPEDVLPLDRKLPESDYLRLRVEDRGCGMDADTVSRIFDPFYTTKFSGRGLGLAAVQGIVRGHDGLLSVTSAPGQGTVFTVLVPGTDAGATPEDTKTGDLGPVGPGCVLFVDDEQMIRELAQRVLEASGLEVLLAADGEEAERLFRSRSHEIGAVVVDLTMPHLSGHEVFENLRSIAADVPVVLASGYPAAEATRRFAPDSLAGFLKKPFAPADLVRVVQAALAAK